MDKRKDEKNYEKNETASLVCPMSAARNRIISGAGICRCKKKQSGPLLSAT